MPLPKILAPYLPEDQGVIEKLDHVLSPVLPFSPVQPTQNRDNVIELHTLDDNSSAEDLEPTDQNAMVLHPMYQPAQVTPPAMDLSPPAEFLQEVYDEPEILDTSTRVVTPKFSEANTLVTSKFIQSSPSPLQPITSNIFPASTNVKDVESKDFPMETNIRKSTSVPTESDFKTKCKRMIRNAKGLVCKPTSPKPTTVRAAVAAAVAEPATAAVAAPATAAPAPIVIAKAGVSMPSPPVKHVTQDRPTLRPIDTSFSPLFMKKEEVCSTPIYLRHHTTSQASMEEKEPAVYASPVKGTVAYDIKLLCEESFFGR
ncbi:hypothetical protein INT47_005341 [Mucor saturninus]|uniref:Uncharacterized protein n=1 Tax=Mucor saturninus TaxID=64648 RepID=A0A8H7RA63_9FUNG|nr:hypothetical protein INT47_005341 [Mucor saturninus]